MNDTKLQSFAPLPTFHSAPLAPNFPFHDGDIIVARQIKPWMLEGPAARCLCLMRQREERRREKRQEAMEEKRRAARLAAHSIRCKALAEARYVRYSPLGSYWYMDEEEGEDFISGRKRKRSLLSVYEGALDASPLAKRRCTSSLAADDECALFIQPVLPLLEAEVAEDELSSSSSDTLVESFVYTKADNVKNLELMEIDHHSSELLFSTVDTLYSPLAPINGEVDNPMSIEPLEEDESTPSCFDTPSLASNEALSLKEIVNDSVDLDMVDGELRASKCSSDLQSIEAEPLQLPQLAFRALPVKGEHRPRTSTLSKAIKGPARKAIEKRMEERKRLEAKILAMVNANPAIVPQLNCLILRFRTSPTTDDPRRRDMRTTDPRKRPPVVVSPVPVPAPVPAPVALPVAQPVPAEDGDDDDDDLFEATTTECEEETRMKEEEEKDRESSPDPLFEGFAPPEYSTPVKNTEEEGNESDSSEDPLFEGVELPGVRHSSVQEEQADGSDLANSLFDEAARPIPEIDQICFSLDASSLIDDTVTHSSPTVIPDVQSSSPRSASEVFLKSRFPPNAGTPCERYEDAETHFDSIIRSMGAIDMAERPPSQPEFQPGETFARSPSPGAIFDSHFPQNVNVSHSDRKTSTASIQASSLVGATENDDSFSEAGSLFSEGRNIDSDDFPSDCASPGSSHRGSFCPFFTDDNSMDDDVEDDRPVLANEPLPTLSHPLEDYKPPSYHIEPSHAISPFPAQFYSTSSHTPTPEAAGSELKHFYSDPFQKSIPFCDMIAPPVEMVDIEMEDQEHLGTPMDIDSQQTTLVIPTYYSKFSAPVSTQAAWNASHPNTLASTHGYLPFYSTQAYSISLFTQRPLLVYGSYG